MKKIKCILFSLIILFSAFVYSGCNQQVNGEPSKKTVDANDCVAELTIYTFDGKPESDFGIINLGHAFIGIKNISEEVLDIGIIVNPDEEITVGTWSIAQHFGVWYNVESNYIADFNKYYGRQSIEKKISLNQIEKIKNFISANDLWTPLKNCSWFAVNLWNCVADKSDMLDTPLIYSPLKLKENLSEFEKVKTNKAVKTSNKVFYISENSTMEYILKENNHA